MADMEELIVRIRADASQLEREFKKAQGIVENSSRGMSGALSNVIAQTRALLPALTVATIVAFGKSAFAAADHLNDLGQRTGFAASTLSALNIKLLQSGSSVDDFASSMNRMNNLIGEAAKGTNQEAIKAFDALGLSVRKLMQLSPEEQFYEITRALAGLSNQAEFTNAGMAIFGRSFSNIAPLIKETDGNLRDYVQSQKDLGNALTDEQLKRLDEYGDKWVNLWEHAKLGALGFLDVLFQINDWVAKQPNPSGGYVLAKVGIPDAKNPVYGPQLPKGTVSDKNPGTQVSWEPFGPKQQNNDARGSNAGLLKNTEIDNARKSLEKYNTELERQHELAGMAPRDQAGMKAYYDTLDLAHKAGIKNAEDLARANEEVAKSNYDMQEAMQESARFAAELKDQFAETAGNIIFDSENAADALSNLGKALAKMLAQRYILGPMSDALFGSPSSGGGGGIFGDLLGSIGGGFAGFFADGGTLKPGQWGIAGENGPEPIYAGGTPLHVTPNKGSGGSIQVMNTFQINAGVQGTVRQELMQAIPAIVQASKDSVFGAIQRGGAEARIVNAR